MNSGDGSGGESVASMRGLDPAWERLEVEVATLMVRASCEDVVDALKGRKGVAKGAVDLRIEATDLGDDDPGDAVFVFQLAGHDWTQVSGPFWWLGHTDLAASLSKRLRCTVVHNVAEGLYHGFNTHLLFEKGNQVEDGREPEEAAADLGMFLAYEVWGTDCGRVVCEKGWDMAAFRGAYLLTVEP